MYGGSKIWGNHNPAHPSDRLHSSDEYRGSWEHFFFEEKDLEMAFKGVKDELVSMMDVLCQIRATYGSSKYLSWWRVDWNAWIILWMLPSLWDALAGPRRVDTPLIQDTGYPGHFTLLYPVYSTLVAGNNSLTIQVGTRRKGIASTRRSGAGCRKDVSEQSCCGNDSREFNSLTSCWITCHLAERFQDIAESVLDFFIYVEINIYTTTKR